MASTSKKSDTPSPAAPPPSGKTNQVNLHTSRNDEITIVGIGASAGGLKALQKFFESLPSSTGLTYVVITHLHPEHESHLAELLQTRTDMPVQQVSGLISVEKDHVYVIPPNQRLVMQDGQININEFKEPRGQRSPIDYFFRSLAHGHPNSVGIILSGSGSDGAVGVKAIKEEGGLLMVQHPDEAEYDSMPLAAIATGLADVVLPVQGLAEKLVEFTRFHPPLPLEADQLTPQQLEVIRRMIAHVHVHTGHDFSHYKRSTLLRRIQRRMQIYGVRSLEEYLDHLRQDAAEPTALFNDILIGVTSFFRDRASWDQLATQVIPQILKEKDPNETVRAWTIGCSTGEEAHGLAILLFEAFDRLEMRPQIQVFASDLDENAIKQAREGIYPTAIEADVSPERLERFFTLEGEHYRVRREVRDAVLFTHHSVLRDAPFSRLDVIACRNLLIYLERDIQNTVFDIFHYSLKPGGYLFLGSSESIQSEYDLFETVDKTQRIYRSKPWNGEGVHLPSLPLSTGAYTYKELYHPPYVPRLPSTIELRHVSDEHAKALESHAPPSVLINDRYAVLHVSETAGRYLVQPSGPMTTDLLKLIRPELQLELRTALLRAFDKEQAILTPPVPVRFNGHARPVVMSVKPLPRATQQGNQPEKQAIIFFLEDEQDEPEIQPLQEPDVPVKTMFARQLEQEVRRLREQLQVSVERYESSNEELQSVNEELQTVNNELKSKLDEVSRAHSDLENLMSSTEIATLFLDRELRIRHYTPGMQKLFNILPGDRGRPIRHLTHTLHYQQFLEDAEGVLRSLVPIEREVQGEAGGWFLLRMRPYRTTDDRIEGVIFTFVEISRLKRAEEQLTELNATLEQRVLDRTQELDEAYQKIAQAGDLFFELFDANPIPTAITRAEDDVFLNVNIEFLNYFGVERDQVIGQRAKNLGLGLALEQKATPEPVTRETFFARIRHQKKIGNYETQVTLPSGEVRTLLASVQYINLENSDAFITTFIDITKRVLAEQKIRALAAELTGTEQSERYRLSRILHDDLQQRLFAVQMHLSFLRDAYEANNINAFQVDFPQLEKWLVEAIRVTRRLSMDISPPILNGEGLREAVIWLAAQMQEQYGLQVDIKASGTPAVVDEKVRVLVFYAVRELLFNIVKHAETAEGAVRFEHYDSHLLVIVKDQGAGFDSAQVMSDPQMAHGLLIIRDRLGLLGCRLNITSQPGKGTEAVIEVPLETGDAYK